LERDIAIGVPMQSGFATDWEESGSDSPPPLFDVDEDSLTVAESLSGLIEEGTEPFEGDRLGPDVSRPVIDSDLENAVVEFVDVFNARDMESLTELLAPHAECTFLAAHSAAAIIDGVEDLILRQPDLVLTRGELDDEPLAGAWLLDADADRYRLTGVFTFSVDDDGLIDCISFRDEAADGDLLLEEPETSERPEWEDWSAQDET
jgi:hypothetical protein